jgi:hypothetical protein
MATTFVKRLERVEAAVREKRLGQPLKNCICFPDAGSSPFFLYPGIRELAFRIKCSLHGDRVQPASAEIPEDDPSRIDLEVGWTWRHASEQYRKAWNATFQNSEWPTEEISVEGRTWRLPTVQEAGSWTGRMCPVLHPGSACSRARWVTTRVVKTANRRKRLSLGLRVFSELGILRRRAYLSNGDIETLRSEGDKLKIAKIELRDIASKLEEGDPYLIGHEHETVYRCAILLLSALEVGNEIAVLAEFTGIPRAL